MAESLTLKIVGADEDSGEARLADFLVLGQSVLACLRVIERHEKARVDYTLSDLKHSSAAMEVEPTIKTRAEGTRVLKGYKRTMHSLQYGKTPLPYDFTRDELETFRQVSRPLNMRAKEVWADGVQLTSDYSANIDRLLGQDATSKGAISGKLDRVNTHGALEFTLYTPLARAGIVCGFPEHLWEAVHDAMRQYVTVYGTMTYPPDSPIPDRVRVDHIDPHEPADDLPTADDLRGLFGPDSIGGLSAADFVRALRDEE